MLTDDEKRFMKYWKDHRHSEKSLFKQLSLGFPIGLLIGAGILANYLSGWYTRATMVGNSQSTPIVLIIAVILIALFCSVFYKRHRWEMNEQRFIELSERNDAENTSEGMQQDPNINSQSK